MLMAISANGQVSSPSPEGSDASHEKYRADGGQKHEAQVFHPRRCGFHGSVGRCPEAIMSTIWSMDTCITLTGIIVITMARWSAPRESSRRAAAAQPSSREP
jgi:hypothetical protein